MAWRSFASLPSRITGPRHSQARLRRVARAAVDGQPFAPRVIEAHAHAAYPLQFARRDQHLFLPEQLLEDRAAVEILGVVVAVDYAARLVAQADAHDQVQRLVLEALPRQPQPRPGDDRLQLGGPQHEAVAEARVAHRLVAL